MTCEKMPALPDGPVSVCPTLIMTLVHFNTLSDKQRHRLKAQINTNPLNASTETRAQTVLAALSLSSYDEVMLLEDTLIDQQPSVHSGVMQTETKHQVLPSAAK